MQTSGKFFDDIAKVANGALSAVAGVREEIEQLIRQQFERYLGEHDLVTYEEFAAVRDQAAKARSEQERLEGRVARLEAELAALKRESAPDSAAAKSTKSKGSETKAKTPRKKPAESE